MGWVTRRCLTSSRTSRSSPSARASVAGHLDANWVATVPHGLDLDRVPFGSAVGGYLAFVGRIAPGEGVADAVALARATGLRLRMAAKVYDEREQDLFAAVVAPAIEEGVVEFLGELGSSQRDELYAGALATVMLGAWPEPFGLVAIESMATGTPVIARRAGALPEIIEHGGTGFLIDDLQEAALAVELASSLIGASCADRPSFASPLTGWSMTTSVCTLPCLVQTFPSLSRSNPFR